MALETEVVNDGKGVVAAVPGSEVVPNQVEPQAGADADVATGTTGDQGEPPAWVRQRISQASRRAQEAERNYQRAQGESEYLRRQLAALTGAQPPVKRSADHEELRSLILEVFPELGEADGRKSEVQELRDKVDFLSKHIWSSRASGVTDKVFGRAKDGFKRDLNDDARDMIQLAFAGFVQRDQDRADRYLSGDDSVVDEFYELMDRGGFFAPSTEVSSISPVAKVAGKVAKLPATGATGGKMLPGAQVKDNSEKDMDELVDMAWDQLQRAR